MDESEFELDLEELSSAEDPAVVHVNRLHILQRFHDYIAEIEDLSVDDVERYEIYSGLLASAYTDFVTSDARTEKVFKVFHLQEPVSVEVPLLDLTAQVVPNAS